MSDDIDIDIYHEPALKEDGTPYRPHILDETGDFAGYPCFVCRHCHVFYADPEAVGGTERGTFPAQVRNRDDVVCPTRMLETLTDVLTSVKT